MRFGKKGDIVNTFMLLAISVFGYVAIAKINDSTDILMRLLTGLMATLYLSFMLFVGIMFVKHNVIEKAINRMATVSNATRYSLAAVVRNLVHSFSFLTISAAVISASADI